MYLLLFFYYKDQFLDISKIDNIIFTKLSDPGINLQLFCIILLAITHGSCRKLNLNAPYINKSKDGLSQYIKQFFCEFLLKIVI